MRSQLTGGQLTNGIWENKVVDAVLSINSTEVEAVVKAIENIGEEVKKRERAIRRVTTVLNDYKTSGLKMVNIEQVLTLLSLSWPDGNYSAPYGTNITTHDSKVVKTIPDLGDDPDGDIEGVDYPPFPADAPWGEQRRVTGHRKIKDNPQA